MTEQQRWTWLDRVLIGAVVLIVLVGVVGSLVRPDPFQPNKHDQPPVGAVLWQTGVPPAPTVVLGGRRKVGGGIVSSWLVSGAGDPSYNGIYNPSGTHNGYPAYTNGSRWLYYTNMIGDWMLPGWVLGVDLTEGFNTPYSTYATELPGLWHLTGVPPANPAPIAPAPTVTAGPTGPDWPWDDWWLWPYDPPIHGPNDSIRPCRAILAGTEYVVFPWQEPAGGGNFTLFDTSGHDFANRQVFADGFFNPNDDAHDPGQTLCSYDAGDGQHIYINRGSFLAGGQPQFTFMAWNIAPSWPARTAIETVNLPSVHITPFLQTPGSPDHFRFLAVSDDGATASLWGYVAFSGNLTLLGEAPVPELPTGFSQVTCAVNDIHRWDHVLLPKGPALYWMRHCKDSASPPQHRIVAATVE